jgi:hypothetical protein
MARKDTIFTSFLKHELITEKHGLIKDVLPKNLDDGLKSENTIVKTIALIVADTESINPSSDKALYSKITQFLNEATI